MIILIWEVAGDARGKWTHVKGFYGLTAQLVCQEIK